MCGFCMDASCFERAPHIAFCPDIGVPVKDIDRAVIIVGQPPQIKREELARHIHEFLEASGGLTQEEIAL